jgi:ADP-ribose pyrophosphatase YjhB (NUDIX family)
LYLILLERYHQTMQPGFDYTGVSVTFFCHDGNGNFLLSRRSEKCRDEHHRWEVGGGKLEFGEDPASGMLREVSEEYGVQGIIEQALPAVSLSRIHNNRRTHWITFPFIVRIPREAVRIGEPEAIEEIGWYRFNKLPTPLHTGMQMVVEKLSDHFRPYIT